MFNRKKNSSFQEMLKNTPEGHMFVSDKFIAVPLPNGQCMAIVGDFRDITEEEANLKLQNALKLKMQ